MQHLLILLFILTIYISNNNSNNFLILCEPGDAALDLTSDNFESIVLSKPTLIDFFAPW